MPDPQDPETFRRSKLDWSERDRSPHRELLAVYRDLIALRAREPDLHSPRLGDLGAHVDEGTRTVTFERGSLRIRINLGDTDWVIGDSEEVLFATVGNAGSTVPPDSAVVTRVVD